jgi:hypothetical protein
MKTIVRYLLIIVVFISCESVFDFENLPTTELVVVDGKISNQIGQSRVILSRSDNFNASSSAGRPITDAAVYIITDDAERIDFISRLNSNVYFPKADFIAQPTIEYQLHIEVDNHKIQSSVETINNNANFGIRAEYVQVDILTDANSIQSRSGHNIFAIFGNTVEPDLYLKWRWEGNYEHPYTYLDTRDRQLGYFSLTSTTDFNTSGAEAFNTAFITNQSLTWQEPIGFSIDPENLEPEDYAGQLTPETVELIIDSLTFINDISPRKEFQYLVSLKQESLTKAAYDYWSEILNQKQNTGSIFDGFPNTINGNLVSNNEEIVLGYFYAVSEISRNYELVYFASKP